MNSKGEFFNVQFFLSGIWRRGKRRAVRPVALLLLLSGAQAAFAFPTTPTGDFIDNKDGTVTHKTTGLTWMRCALGQEWTGSTCLGTESAYTYDQAVALTHTFAEHSDWRLPNIAELQTIVERENIKPAINAVIFPNTPSHAFWSSSHARHFGEAWIVGFYSGSNSSGLIDFNSFGLISSYAVRLVRASQSLAIDLSSPNTDFTNNRDGTATHKRTGLVWRRCLVGQAWTGQTCLGILPPYYSYDDALALSSNFAGHSDWRVPNANELASIVKYDNDYPAAPMINTTVFPSVFPSTYRDVFWSSSPYAGDADVAWSVGFFTGYVRYDGIRISSFSVRLVRSRQSLRYWPSITVTKNGTGTGTVISKPEGISCGTTCIEGFSSGQKVTLSANPDANSVFVRWKGDCTGTQPGCIVTVKKGKYVTAVFKSALN